MGAQHPEVFGSMVHGTSSLVEWILYIILRDPGRPCQDRKRLREVPQAFPMVHRKEAEDTSKRTPVFSPSSYQSSGQKATDRAGALSLSDSFGKVKG